MLDGRSWKLAEVPQDVAMSYHQSQHAVSRQNTASVDHAYPDPPAVVSQHLQNDRQFVVINSKVMNSSIIYSHNLTSVLQLTWHLRKNLHCLEQDSFRKC